MLANVFALGTACAEGCHHRPRSEGPRHRRGHRQQPTRPSSTPLGFARWEARGTRTAIHRALRHHVLVALRRHSPTLGSPTIAVFSFMLTTCCGVARARGWCTRSVRETKAEAREAASIVRTHAAK